MDVNLYKDYLTRIRNPMDFGTIKGRLDAGFYTFNSDGFAADMRQVFENAFTYNAAGSDVHSMAMTLKVQCREAHCPAHRCQGIAWYNCPPQQLLASQVHGVSGVLMLCLLQDKFEERMKGLASRMAGVDNERSREEEELRELARRRLQVSALLFQSALGITRNRHHPTQICPFSS